MGHKYMDLGAAQAAALVTPAPTVASVAAGDGPIVDLAGVVGEAIVVLNALKASAGTNPTLDFTLCESDDQSTWFDIIEPAFPQMTDAADQVAFYVFRPGTRKRYITAAMVVGGTDSPSFPVSMAVVYLAP
jgi:hypothetical protein